MEIAAPSGCPTTIAVLHTAYETASEAYNANDEATFSPDNTPTVEYIHQRAMDELSNQQDLLRAAILREMPANMQDALIVAWHASGAADLVKNGSVTCPEVIALEVTMQNLVAFLAVQDGAHVEEGGWFARQLDCPLRYSAARSGQIAAVA